MEVLMTIKSARWLFLALLAILISQSLWEGAKIVGVTMEWHDDVYRFAAGTAPRALAISPITILLYLLLMYLPPAEAGTAMKGIVRRFVAFWLDFYRAISAMAPILGIIPTFVEWRRTGGFAWSFERDSPARGDVVQALGLTLLAFAILAFYFAWPLVRRRPSPGACILGYQILADNGLPLTLRKALLRTIRGFVAVCLCWLEPFKTRNSEQGKFWLDEIFGTHAVKLN
jgi:uncharacterized RDD family membrane protein YckC